MMRKVNPNEKMEEYNMKRVAIFFVAMFMTAGLFAQNAAYQKKLAEAKSFEAQGKWVNALSSYYDAMEAEPTEKAQDAYEAYEKLADAIRSGKPGYMECLDEFDVYDGWISIVDEYSEFWNTHNSVSFWTSGLIKKGVDMKAKTADYSVHIMQGVSPKYFALRSVILSGWQSAWTSDWPDCNGYSLPIEENPENRRYSVSAKVLNQKGRLLFNLPATELKWGFDEVSDERRNMYTWNIKGISREDMRLISSRSTSVQISSLSRVVGGERIPMTMDSSEFAVSDGSPKVDAVKIVGMKFKAKMKFVFVEGGTFRMGYDDGDDDEVPIHSVTLDSFYMGATEVTQGQWEAVMGNRPSEYEGDLRPVENVSWYDILVFCNKLSIMEGLTPVYTIDGVTDPSSWSYTPCRGNTIRGDISMDRSANGYRLPTEAEWEYAACGGNRSKGYMYSGSSDIDSVGWYDDNAYSTHDVAEKEPNELGIYDMTGNVWEWVWDIHGDYSSAAQTNPTGAIGDYDDDRVLRGGGHSSWSRNCRNACRGLNDPDSRHDYNGFRVARSKM